MHTQTSLAGRTPAREAKAGWHAGTYRGACVGGGILFAVLLFDALIILRAFDRPSPPPVSVSSACIDITPAAVSDEIVNLAPCFLTSNQTRHTTEYRLDRDPGILPERAALADLRFAKLDDDDMTAATTPLLIKAPDQRGSTFRRRSRQKADSSSPSVINIQSPLVDAILQNTRGYSEGYPRGVPRNYNWCAGSYKPNAGPPEDFTAVVGWGQVYPKIGAGSNTELSGTIEIARAKTYLRLKATKQWILVQDQDQAKTPIGGAYFAADFSPRKQTIEMPMSQGADSGIVIAPPPSGFNAHFWLRARGTYPAGEIDGAYVQMDMRTTTPETRLVANVGADWWRDATADFEPSFANNPGAGMSNWVELSDEWSTLRFFSLSTPELRLAPPPPLLWSSQLTTPAAVKRRVGMAPSPCLRSESPAPPVFRFAQCPADTCPSPSNDAIR